MSKKRLIIEAIALALIITSCVIIYVNKVLRAEPARRYDQRSTIEVKVDNEWEENEDSVKFGIVAGEDIYVDNTEKNRKYTSHGRLILSKSERGW